MLFVLMTTSCGAYELITSQFWPLTQSVVTAEAFRGYLNILMTIAIVICTAVILLDACLRTAARLTLSWPP